MKREVGLWIDRRKAVIVTIAHDGDGIVALILEKHVRFRDFIRMAGWEYARQKLQITYQLL
jgi:hypothetical protein